MQGAAPADDNQPAPAPNPPAEELPANHHFPPLFLRLPPELRNTIYADILGGIQIKVTERPSAKTAYQCLSRSHPSGPFSSAHFRLYIALTRTCRQLYAETRLLPFMLNPQLWHKPKTFVKWFVSVEQQVRDAVWIALDEAQRRDVRDAKEYRNMLAVERYNDLVGAVEMWSQARAWELFEE